VEDTIGKHTNIHLYLYQRIAGIQRILKDLDGVEETFHKCIDVAENGPLRKGGDKTRIRNIFTWQNNVLKFYLDNNIDKAIDYGNELLDQVGPILDAPELQDLQFSLGTAHSLKCDDLDQALVLYDFAL
jgi:hypothetical protein